MMAGPKISPSLGPRFRRVVLGKGSYQETDAQVRVVLRGARRSYPAGLVAWIAVYC